MSVPSTPSNPNRPKSVSINENLNGSDASVMSPEQRVHEEDKGMATSPLPPIAATSADLEGPWHTGLSEDEGWRSFQRTFRYYRFRL